MPLYDYLCSCGETTARIRTYAQRLDTVKCPHCLGDAEYQFPVGAVRGIRFFEEQYCEPLGCDVTSERDMVEKAKKLGYVQAGDKVRGGRNEHDILAPTRSRRGISIDDKLREKDQRKGHRGEAPHSPKPASPLIPIGSSHSPQLKIKQVAKKQEAT